MALKLDGVDVGLLRQVLNHKRSWLRELEKDDFFLLSVKEEAESCGKIIRNFELALREYAEYRKFLSATLKEYDQREGFEFPSGQGEGQ